MGDVIVNISTFIRENKQAAIIGGICIVAFIVLFMFVTGQRNNAADSTETENTAQEEQVQDVQAAEQQLSNTTPQGAAIELTPYQSDLLASARDYTDLYGYLQTSAWTGSRESRAIVFGDKYYQEFQEAGHVETVTFVIANAYADANGDFDVWYMDCVGADGKPFFIVLTIDYSNERSMTLHSDNFVNTDTYYRVSSTGEVSLYGIPDEVYGYCRISADTLAEQVSDYCSYMFPTARGAIFSGLLSFNFERREATFSLSLDNESQSSVPVVIGLDDAHISIGESGATR